MRIYLLLLIANISGCIELQKVFHHRIASERSQPAHIELGKIVLYFDQEPSLKIQEQSDSKKNKEQLVFFMPGIQATSAEVKKMISMLNTSDQSDYHATLNWVQQPSPGLELAISYDPKKVFMWQKPEKYESFEAITKAKSIEFRIFNKSLLEMLNHKKQSVLRTSHHKKPTIIIDCGHGGSDAGAIGLHNIVEKEITLAMGKQLASVLQKEKFKVVLTRTDDSFIALDERTRIANLIPSDAILISLHANKCARSNVQGLETFCLASTRKKSTGLETAIDVMIQAHDEQRNKASERLAQKVHARILQTIQAHGFISRDRKVRHAATQMLLGIKWPGILIEADYLSNELAAHQLKNPEFRQIFVEAICQGIKDCF